MAENRIFFRGNPWPEGHPIKEFEWTAIVRDNDVWFNMHLKSDWYYAEREIKEDKHIEHTSDWVAPIVWNNFHACTMSSTHTNRGFKVCSVQQYSPEYIDGLEIEVDTDPESIVDHDDFTFGIYLLGHDAAARHKIKFERIGTSLEFNIIWVGNIARAYVGEYDYKYDFNASLDGVALPKLDNDA